MRGKVPERVTLRIDRELRQQLEIEMAATKRSLSQVLRMALVTGLDAQEELGVQFRRAAFREGVVAGIAAFRKAGGPERDQAQREMTRQALDGVDAALAGWEK